jgi:hypothetical protein
MVILMRVTLPAAALVLILAAAAPAVAQTAAPTAPAASTAPAVNWNDTQWILYGRQIAEWFFGGQTDSILAHSSPDVLERMGGAQGLLGARDELLARAGSETKVITDKMTKRKGNPQYWRESDYENAPEPIVLRFVFNAQAQVIGIGMGPLSQSPAPDPS